MSAVAAPKSPEGTSQVQFPELKSTSNNLADVIKWINDGNIVALHTQGACRAFHNLGKEVDLSQRRVVYINCNPQPGLLAKGEWEDDIHSHIPSVTELPSGDVLRNKIIEQQNVPNKQYVKLSY